jgi:hypothetical protein
MQTVVSMQYGTRAANHESVSKWMQPSQLIQKDNTEISSHTHRWATRDPHVMLLTCVHSASSNLFPFILFPFVFFIMSSFYMF